MPVYMVRAVMKIVTAHVADAGLCLVSYLRCTCSDMCQNAFL